MPRPTNRLALDRAALETLEARRLLAADLQLDPAFGDAGRFDFAFGDANFQAVNELLRVGDHVYAFGGEQEVDFNLPPDIVGGGTTLDVDLGNPPTTHVARLLPGGGLDPAFGNTGIAAIADLDVAGWSDFRTIEEGEGFYASRLGGLGGPGVFEIARFDDQLNRDDAFPVLSLPLDLDFAGAIDYGIDFDADADGDVVVARFTADGEAQLATFTRYDATGTLAGSGSVTANDVLAIAAPDGGFGILPFGFREVGALDDGGAFVSYARTGDVNESANPQSLQGAAIARVGPDLATVVEAVADLRPDVDGGTRYLSAGSAPDGRYALFASEDEGAVSSAGGFFVGQRDFVFSPLPGRVEGVAFPESGGVVQLSGGSASDAAPINFDVGTLGAPLAYAYDLSYRDADGEADTFVFPLSGRGGGSYVVANAMTMIGPDEVLVAGSHVTVDREPQPGGGELITGARGQAALWRLSLTGLPARPDYAEVDGLVEIEAAAPTGQGNGDSPAQWETIADDSLVGGEGIAALPDAGFFSGNTLAGDRHDYAIAFTTPGTYHAWLRMAGSGAFSDSVHLGLDGAPLTFGGVGLAPDAADGSYRWANGQTSLGRRVTIDVPAAGTYTLNLWVREDGVRVDEIRLSDDPAYEPGEPASPNEPPVVGSLSATPNPVVAGGALSLSASGVADPDGAVALVEFGLLGGSGEVPLGVDGDGVDGWGLEVPASELPGVGDWTYYAVAVDDEGARGERVTVRVEVVPPGPSGRRVIDFAGVPEGPRPGGFATGGFEFLPRFSYQTPLVTSQGYASAALTTREWGEAIDFGPAGFRGGGAGAFDLASLDLASGRFGGEGDALITGFFADGTRQSVSASFEDRAFGTLELDWRGLSFVRVGFAGGVNANFGAIDNVTVAVADEGEPDVDAALAALAPKALDLAAGDLLYDFVGPDGDWATVAPAHWTAGYTPGLLFEVAELLERRGDARASDLRGLAVDQAERVRTSPLRVEDTGHRMLTGMAAYRDAIAAYGPAGAASVAEVEAKMAAEADARDATFNDVVGAYPGLWRPKPGEVGVLVDQLLDVVGVQERIPFAGADAAEIRDRVRSHGRLVAEHHLRDDGSTNQWVYFDAATGEAIGGDTFQGLAPDSAWSRGQAWAILGFAGLAKNAGHGNGAMTDMPFSMEMTRAAERAADFFLDNLPAGGIPPWDFDAPADPATPTDTSAAAIAAYALQELAGLPGVDAADARRYRDGADGLLASLIRDHLVPAGEAGLLGGGSGNVPDGVAVDTSLIFGDYWFARALNAYEARP